MTYSLNVKEVLNMARAIERNGVRFYERAATHCGKEEEKMLLLGLAAEEVQHEKVFEALQEQVAGTEPASGTFDPDDMASLYLQALADKNVFDVDADPVELLGEDANLEDILRMAIGLEKDSIVFYVGLKEALGDRSNKDKVDQILQEEMGHVSTLRRELTRLVKG